VVGTVSVIVASASTETHARSVLSRFSGPSAKASAHLKHAARTEYVHKADLVSVYRAFTVNTAMFAILVCLERTALWNAVVEASAEGKATATLQVPAHATLVSRGQIAISAILQKKV